MKTQKSGATEESNPPAKMWTEHEGAFRGHSDIQMMPNCKNKPMNWEKCDSAETDPKDAFGRWVSALDHRTWHSGIGYDPGGRFNYEWTKFIADEPTTAANGVAYTYTEIIDKLASIRAQFPVTGGHD